MTTEAPAPPRAFATGAPQTRAALAGAPRRFPPRPGLLTRPLTALEGVGPAAARHAAKLGIEMLGDLLGHLPFDHRDYADARPVAELAIGEEATVAVTVKDCRVRPTRRRRLTILESRVADDTGPLTAVWFNQAYLADQLVPGVRVLLRGKLEGGRGGPTFRVSAHEIERTDGDGAGRHTTGLVPVYPATEGLSARRIRELAFAVRGLAPHAPEPLDARLRTARALPGKPSASPLLVLLSPGYHKRAEAGARLSRDFLRWTKAIQDMVASKADWQLVPFNQWIEGAATESSMTWRSPSTHGFYLDTLHNDGAGVDRIVVAAGDVACQEGAVTDVSGEVSRCHQQSTANLFVDYSATSPQPMPGLTAVLALGDLQYHCGAYPQFEAQFGTTWGDVKALIRPTIGNHEYNTTSQTATPGDAPCGGQNATGYFQYFGSGFGAPRQARYSFDIGSDWHLISLDSNCLKKSACDIDEQDRWLRDHLNGVAGDPVFPGVPQSMCVLAYWHHPRFSTYHWLLPGAQRDRDYLMLWTHLYAHRADLVLNGHDHVYERFKRQDQDTNLRTDGIRQIIVRTGGRSAVRWPNTPSDQEPTFLANSEPGAAADETYGVLQMVLYDRPVPSDPTSRGSYTWQFVPETPAETPAPGTLFQDNGWDVCN